ncbi:MAG: hypothetical protein OXC29_01380, partial [Rhodococcus sp.]|nr:hypothetical protein [Rhodococcus sp. (in: high G+C Gram-positive bacteria)]
MAFPAVTDVADFFVGPTGETLVSYSAANAPTSLTSLTIDDDEVQDYQIGRLTSPGGVFYEIDATQAIKEIAISEDSANTRRPRTFYVKAVPAHVQGSLELSFHVDNRLYGLSPSTLTLGSEDGAAADNEKMVTITGPPVGSDGKGNDGNRDDDKFTLTTASGTSANPREIATTTIAETDIHKLQKVKATVVDEDGRELVQQPESVEEGEFIFLRVSIDDQPANPPSDGITTAKENLTIELEPTGTADELDYSIAQNQPIRIGVGERDSSPIRLTVTRDQDVGEEMLVLSALVYGEREFGVDPGEPHEVLTLTIDDETLAQVKPKPDAETQAAVDAARKAMEGDEGLNPGEKFDVMMADLFTVTTGFTATYGASSSNPAAVDADVVSGDRVTLTPIAAGTSTVTVTATARAAASATSSQTISNVAEVSFDVTVTDTKLMVTSLTADPMEIDEGGMSTISANLNRAVTSGDGEVMIGLSVVGDGTLDMESLTIAMGEMSGSAMLTAADDDDYMDTEVTVVATGSGIDSTMQVTVMVTDKDEAPTTVMAKADAQSVFDDNVGSDFIKGGDAVSFDASNLFEQFGADVDPVFAVTSSNDMVVGAAISGSMLTLTPAGYGAATIEVTVTDRTSGQTATASGDVMVGLADLVLTVTADPMEIMEGGETVLHVSANREVAASDSQVQVRWTIIGDATIDDNQTTIAVGDSTANSAPVVSTDDDEHEEGETVTVAYSGTGIDGTQQIVITVIDNDDAPEPPVVEPTVTAKDNAAQMILDAVATAASGADWMVGGMVATVDMADLFTADEGAAISYAGMSSSEAVMVGTSGTMLMLTPMAEGVSTITVTASDTASMDVARVDADVAVALQTLSIGVAASADTVMEGGSITLTATANRAVTAETMLTLTVTGDTDAVSADAMITLAMGQTTGTGMVMALEDDDSADAMVSVVVSGTVLASPVTFDIAITDNDPTVSAKTQAEVDAVFTVAVATASGTDGWVPTSQGGEAATLDMGDLFDTNGSPTLEYMAESSAADMVAVSASGSMLTLTPMAMGDATITVTATDTSGDAADTAMVSAMVKVGVIP